MLYAFFSKIRCVCPVHTALTKLIDKSLQNNNWDIIRYILDQTNFFNEKKNNDCATRLLYATIEKKQFDIASKILNQSLINNLNNVHIFTNSYNGNNSYNSIFYVTIEFLDVEALLFLLKATNFSIVETKISALDYAILNGSYESACLLKLLNFKSTASNNTELTEEEQKKIQEFMSKPISLSKSAAIALGMKYINEQLTVEQAIAISSLYLAKKVETIADVFSLNLIYP